MEARVEREDFPMVRVTGDCMVPRINPGAWICYDPYKLPAAGDMVVARVGESLLVKGLHEWDGVQWLVAVRNCAPILVEPPLEILGVVRLVMYA